MSSPVSFDKIPNNVNLSSDRKLQRALEEWQPNFLQWWIDMGPEGFQQDDIYLRTAVSVDTAEMLLERDSSLGPRACASAFRTP